MMNWSIRQKIRQLTFFNFNHFASYQNVCFISGQVQNTVIAFGNFFLYLIAMVLENFFQILETVSWYTEKSKNFACVYLVKYIV